MKDYPRIHSLSTVGLIYHQDSDYKFQELRTDFIGDSGCGKSIIADLLQLILVGSDRFEAATQSMDKNKKERKPNGLVLDSLGYAFINVEMQENKYIVVGVIIEKTNTSTKAFIIQESNDFSKTAKLVPLNKPIKSIDFTKDNGKIIIQWQDLKGHFHDQATGFNHWIELENFHLILSNPENAIIPFNFDKNKNALNDYANIIRSFARGNKIDAKDNNSLQEFLFGNNDKKEIEKKYKEEKSKINKQSKDNKRNKEAINVFKKKLVALKDLKAKSEKYEYELNKWLIENTSYWYSQDIDCSKTFNDTSKTIIDSFLKLSVIQTNILGIESNLDSKRSKAISENENAQKIYNEKKVLYDKLIKVESWIKEFDTNSEGLKQIYADEKEKEKLKKNLQELQGQFDTKDLWNYFENSKWANGYQEGYKWYLKEVQRIDSDIELNESLQVFIDLKNPDSLGYWAINNLHKPISHEQESIVRYFQIFSREKIEKVGKRALVNPKELFDDSSIKDKNDDGFWLNLKGIWEYINYCPNRILNTDNLESFIKKWSFQLEEELKKYISEKKLLGNLFSILSQSDSQLWLTAYIKRDLISDFQPIEEFKNIDVDNFDIHLNCLNQEETIRSEYNNSKENAGNTLKISNDFRTIATKINGIKEQAKVQIENLLGFNKLLVDKKSIALEFVDNKDEFEDTIDFIETINECDENLQTIRNNLPTQKRWEEAVLKYIEAKAELDKAEKECEKYIEKKVEYIEIVEKPNSFDKDSAFRVFFDKYNGMIVDYLLTEKYKYDNTEPDFLVISKALFINIDIGDGLSKEGIITSIDKELSGILLKNQQIAFSKLQLIKSNLEKVETAVNKYAEIRVKIKNFFEKPENKISGVFTPKLEWIDSRKDSSLYPLKWIEDFIDDVDNKEMLSSIAKATEDDYDIDEKMIAAFKKLSGSNIFEPNISDLLNPHSYYKLTFEMESKHGRKTQGSTGQAYSALALLCIARLSIIEEEKGDKKVKGIRFMAIDEAEGLGSNYNVLYQIAEKYDYQIITLSINIVGSFKEGQQFIYMLHQDVDADAINYPPYAIFTREDRDNYETEIELESA